MEPIQIFDHIKQKNFEFYVSQEVAERCRIDSVFADDLYRQIKDQNIEEGSFLEIETQLVDQEKSSITSSKQCSQRGWSHQEVFKLIKLYLKLKMQLKQTPTAAFWSKISEELSKQNFYKSSGQCRDKWRTLKKRYRIALETGDRSKFIFFNKFDNIVKSLEATKDDTGQNETLEETSDEYSDQDLDSSTSVVNKRFWAWTKPGSKPSGESRQFWSNPEVHIFLKMLDKHKGSRKICKTSYQFWSLLSAKLNQVPIKKTPRQCWRKWKNLLFTYRRVNKQIVKNPAVIVRFPFYEIIKKIMNDKNQEEDGTETDDDNVDVLDYDNHNDESLMEEGQVDDIKKVWTEDHTLALINVYKKNINSYNKFEFKKQFWEHIAQSLNTKGFSKKDAEQCKNKWKSLLKYYEDCSASKDNNFIVAHALEDVFKNFQERESEVKATSSGEASGISTCEQIIIEAENEESKAQEILKKNLGKMWTNEESITLIDMFGKYKNQPNNNKCQNSQFWYQISAGLKTNHIDKSSEECEKQWNCLYNSYLKHKQLNVVDLEFVFTKHMDKIFQPPPDIKPEVVNKEHNGVNIPHGQCLCAEKIVAEKKIRHQDRMDLLRRKLDIEGRKIKAFEEYIKHIKGSS